MGMIITKVICKLCLEECRPTEYDRYYGGSIHWNCGWECINPDCDNDEIGDMSGLCENFIIDEGDDEID